MKNILKRIVKSVVSSKTKSTSQLPANGYTDNLQNIKFVSYISDNEVEELNALLNWKAFVADYQGRRLGNMAWTGKRTTPQAIPDPRHALLNTRIPLNDKKILEIGCFEGIHTISLCRLAREVVAIDSRMENVVKTIVRSNLFGEKPTVLKCDVEMWDAPEEYLHADVCHHIGVLYHLKDPVTHLYTLSRFIKDAIFLDTHIAHPTDPLQEYSVNGKTYRYKKYDEGGVKDVFSGMYDHAKWLLLEDLKAVLIDCGYTHVEVIEERAERNGPRVLLLAKR